MFGRSPFEKAVREKKKKMQRDRIEAKKNKIQRDKKISEIERENANGNHSRVTALFREIIKGNEYTVIEKMKYCHIAADSVCKSAKTVKELEEARTWTMVIKRLSGIYSEEASKLYDEITNRRAALLAPQDALMREADMEFDFADADSAKSKLKKAGDNGSLMALIILADKLLEGVSSDADVNEVREAIKRIRAIDKGYSKIYEDRLKQIPYVKLNTHRDKAEQYAKESEKAVGEKKISFMKKEIEELKLVYQTAQPPQIATQISTRYVKIADTIFKSENDNIDEYMSALNTALEWANKAANGGDTDAVELIEMLKAQIGILTMHIEARKAEEEKPKTIEEHWRKVVQIYKEFDNKDPDKFIQLLSEEARELEELYNIEKDLSIADLLFKIYRGLARAHRESIPDRYDALKTYIDFYEQALKWAEIVEFGGGVWDISLKSETRKVIEAKKLLNELKPKED